MNEPKLAEYPQVKILCVGLNKTGTTTFGDALQFLGYRRLGWRPSISAPLMLRWHEGEFEPFARQLAEHDVFEDMPWCLVYREVDRLYPNARFVLTLRRSPEAWLDSMQRHLERTGKWVGTYLHYGSYDARVDAQRFLDAYNRHNDAVRSHFASRPGKLLEATFENGDGWAELCGFLGVAPPADTPFPHSNRDARARPSEAAS